MGRRVFSRERKWRQLERMVGVATEDIAITRWTDVQNSSRHEEVTTPPERYFIGITLKITRLKLTSGRETLFDGIMPAGSLYVSAPSKQLSAQFNAPCDFLHFHVSADYFPSQRSATQLLAAEGRNNLVLLRDPLAQQLAKALTEHGNTSDEKFARCIGQTLAMHVAQLKLHEPGSMPCRNGASGASRNTSKLVLIAVSPFPTWPRSRAYHACTSRHSSGLRQDIVRANISCISASNTRSRCCRIPKCRWPKSRWPSASARRRIFRPSLSASPAKLRRSGAAPARTNCPPSKYPARISLQQASSGVVSCRRTRLTRLRPPTSARAFTAGYDAVRRISARMDTWHPRKESKWTGYQRTGGCLRRKVGHNC